MIIQPWPNFEEDLINPFEDYKLPPRLIYHYTTFNTAKLIIEGQTLKFSQPNTFNDPFDMYEELVSFSYTPWQFREWIKDNVKEKRKNRRVLEDLGQRKPEDIAKLFRETLSKLKRNSGVCCFSKIPDQTLMWSHYAERHRGICLGFNIVPFIEKQDFVVFEVNYPDEIDKVNFFTDRDKLLRHWALTKMKAWSYEQEARAIIRDTKKQSFFEFDKACLKEIIFGYSFKEKDMVEVIKLLSDHGYNLNSKKKMIIDNHCFELKAIDV